MSKSAVTSATTSSAVSPIMRRRSTVMVHSAGTWLLTVPASMMLTLCMGWPIHSWNLSMWCSSASTPLDALAMALIPVVREAAVWAALP